MKKIIFLSLIAFFCSQINAQVGIGNTDPKSTLDISSSNVASPTNTDGILIPRIDDFPATPPTIDQDGMMVFATGNGTPTKGFYYWDNGTTSWIGVGGAGVDTQNTLDEAYDEGGAGAGRTVNVDNGSLEFIGNGSSNFTGIITNTSAKNGLQINTSGDITAASPSSNSFGIELNNTVNPNDSFSNSHGIFNRMTVNGTATGGSSYGFRNWFLPAGTTNGILYSFFAINQNASNRPQYGYYNRSSNSGSGPHYGFFAEFIESGTGPKWGVYTEFGDSSSTVHDMDGELVGYEVVFDEQDLVGASGNKYGLIVDLSSIVDGQHYGVYSDVQKATGYAGYFLGRTSLGNSTTNRYLMPAADGTAGQVMTTDGAGNLSFTTPSSGGVTLDGAYDFGGAGTGRIITADNGAVEIQDVGGLRVEGDITAAANIIHDGDADTFISFTPDRVEIDAGGTNYINIENANQEITLNEDSAQIDFRVETDGESNMFFIDGSENKIGIGTNTPDSPFHIDVITPFDLDYLNIGQDDIFLTGGGANAINEVGASIGFGGTSNRNYQRRAAISSLQTGGDVDHTGLAFYVHGNAINQSPMVEGMRLSHQGYLGINNTSPDATLDVVGTMQFVDGNESNGFVLTSDATGNASWSDPSAIITDTQNTLDEAYDEGGAGAGRIITADNGAVSIEGNSGFQVTGPFNTGAPLALSGAGTRLFFNPRTSAFRAGTVDGTQWDLANVGSFSIALGSNTIASGVGSVSIGNDATATGNSSVALGLTTTASGINATAFGSNNTASGSNSTAFGFVNTASGYGSVAFGYRNTAHSSFETVLGAYATNYTPVESTSSVTDPSDRVLVVGNGTSNAARSNALTLYKDGSLNINDAYTLPNSDGTAGQVMTTDGAGVASWTTPSGGTTTSIVRALLSSSQLLPNSTSTKISFDSILFDTNSDFDTTNNRFVAPRDGYYRVNAAITANNASPGALYIQIYKNGVLYQRDNFGISSGPQFKTIDGIVALNVGEYVEIFVIASPANYNIPSTSVYTFFEVQEIK